MARPLHIRDLFTEDGAAEVLQKQGIRVPSRRKRAPKLDGKSWAEVFGDQWRAHGLPPYVAEMHFALKDPGRRWRVDYACPQEPYRLLVEIEGLVVVNTNVAKLEGSAPIRSRDGRHVVNVLNVTRQLVAIGRHASITGFREDCVKYGWANILGYHLLRWEQSQVKSEEAITLTEEFFKRRGWKAP